MVDHAPVVVAVAQLALAVGERGANQKAAAAAVAAAAAAGARLVVLPELSDSGYVFGTAATTAQAEARSLASPAAASPTLHDWRDLAAAHRLVVVGGFCELGTDGLLYDSAAVVDAEGVRAVYRKAHLWDREKLVFTPGDAPPPVVDVGFGRVAVMVCYDLEFPEWVRLAALDGADLIAVPVNWPGPAATPQGQYPPDVIEALADAAANGVFVAVADRCRAERGVCWTGGSLIAGPNGHLLAGPVLAGRPAVLTAVCDLPRARNKSLGGDADRFADRRPALYTRLIHDREGPGTLQRPESFTIMEIGPAAIAQRGRLRRRRAGAGSGRGGAAAGRPWVLRHDVERRHRQPPPADRAARPAGPGQQRVPHARLGSDAARRAGRRLRRARGRPACPLPRRGTAHRARPARRRPVSAASRTRRQARMDDVALGRINTPGRNLLN